MNRIEELTVQIRAARLAGDWDEHLRLWEERRVAEVEADEAMLTRQLDMEGERHMTKDKDVKIGSVVAFNTLPDAVWFDVVDTQGVFHLIVREHGTDYAKQWADRSMVKQVKETT